MTKAITCFEYSLHMRKTLYGREEAHPKILQSLVYLGAAWAEYGNLHRLVNFVLSSTMQPGVD